ncbi:MAG: ribosomal-protein-alanine N-acetyltransferase [Firmicutes bacterium ADurb.Bin182]|nr:MAG: ribosomal-protein-alanine N-acetyltransferase [Firmicutes bacterium ADurb.Bin182]
MADEVFRRMEKKDVAKVAQLERLCFSMPWSERAIAGELKNKAARYCVLERDGEIIAYAGMWIVFNEAHITNVAVAPDYRRQGVGFMMMCCMMKLALSLGASEMTLEVRERNFAAQALYAKCRFERAGLRPKYYQDTGEGAIILWNRDIGSFVDDMCIREE